MKLDESIGLVLDCICEKPHINLNELARVLKGKVSRVRLFKVISELKKHGAIHLRRDERHKQKMLVYPSEGIKDAYSRLSTKAITSAVKSEEILDSISEVVLRYKGLLDKLTSVIERWYVHYRASKTISDLLISAF